MAKSKIKKVRVRVPNEYSPEYVRRNLRLQYEERFFKLFCSQFDFGESLSPEERIVILKLLWENGSFNVARSPAPMPELADQMDLTFTKYAIDSYDFNLRPLEVHNVPYKSTPAVNEKPLTIGKDAVIVYLNEFSEIHYNYGVLQTAKRYIEQIVSAKMTINTNLLTMKLPYIVSADISEIDAFKNILSQVFGDYPAILAPASMQGKELKTLQTNTPYYIDKLEAYITRIENMFLDEIGIDNVKPIQGGQDRLLLDETNANNALINNFRGAIFKTLQEGFSQVEEIFGRKIEVKPSAEAVSSIHEEINEEEEEGEKEKEENKA